MESPANEARWRLLPGRTPDRDELRIKVNQLEERLNDKREQLLERDLILSEVRCLLHRMLRCQVIESLIRNWILIRLNSSCSITSPQNGCRVGRLWRLRHQCLHAKVLSCLT